MISIRDIERASMTPEKKEMAKNDYFAFYIGRPLSYILTIPFLYTSLTPNQVSVISIIPLVIGFALSYMAESDSFMYISWCCFFLWNLLDGVDGNMARYRKSFSKMGSVYDAMSGYAAMILSFFAWGIAAAHFPGILNNYIHLNPELYIILGGISGISVIFPRFIMHKAITTVGTGESINTVKDKSKYGVIKIIALNLISISGFVQVLMLIAVPLKLYDLFTLSYFILNLLVMVVSLKFILK
ncbi:CDP-alcohol phosphatidyltransferase family protein [Megasphaera sp. An286]|uniref:CDP-alcohol phosphatidyltransferase family protein n=1 Tax=Megasphaera sp. An286 TaxID=1965622 RepID=UPI0019524993|nr:CDP-alcohol phosphatidyltransferase family protein [Megasphaera sp. An286]